MKVALVLVLLCLVAQVYSACTQDWECGNPVYFDCVQQPVCTLIPGVGRSPNRVYWLERCEEGGNSTVYLMRAGTLIERVAVVPETSPLGALGIVTELISANYRAVYVMRSQRLSGYVSVFTQYGISFLPEALVAYPRGYNFDVAFDYDQYFQGTPVASYVCSQNTIIKYNSLNFTLSDNYTVLYTTRCDHISFYNNKIYWAKYFLLEPNSQNVVTQFYQGNTNCSSCDEPQMFATVNGLINDFEVGGGRIYYGLPNSGIESIALDSPNVGAAVPLISAGNINALKIDGNRIWFNNGVSIQGINVDQTDLRNSSRPSAANSVCACISGFSGANCDQCENGIVYWTNGTPNCVKYDVATGFPSSCVEDWHCGNVPYTRCENQKCICATGPNGISPSCNTCANGAVIAWNNGVPACAA
jgi:hypothetical protein